MARWTIPPANPALRSLAADNPAARSLRLLEVLAGGRGGQVRTSLLDGALCVTVGA